MPGRQSGPTPNRLPPGSQAGRLISPDLSGGHQALHAGVGGQLAQGCRTGEFLHGQHVQIGLPDDLDHPAPALVALPVHLQAQGVVGAHPQDRGVRRSIPADPWVAYHNRRAERDTE
jgi:hypothetical protein